MVKSILQNQYVKDYQVFINDKEVMRLIGLLLLNKNLRLEYLTNPRLFINKYEFNVNEKYQAYICYYFDCLLRGKMSNPIGKIFEM